LELAPRDVVARSIISEMEKTGSDCVYLDLTHKSECDIKQRFPMIYEMCLKYGYNIVSDWIPVSPAAHYMMGGVKTNVWGETSLPRLFACGEVACTSVHGANRLASNSLSEAVVFGNRIAHKVRELAPLERDQFNVSFLSSRGIEPCHVDTLEERLILQNRMVQAVGLFREKKQLLHALKSIEQCLLQIDYEFESRLGFEYFNMLTCSLLIVKAALAREESRGGHYRIDFP